MAKTSFTDIELDRLEHLFQEKGSFIKMPGYRLHKVGTKWVAENVKNRKTMRIVDAINEVNPEGLLKNKNMRDRYKKRYGEDYSLLPDYDYEPGEIDVPGLSKLMPEWMLNAAHKTAKDMAGILPENLAKKANQYAKDFEDQATQNLKDQSALGYIRDQINPPPTKKPPVLKPPEQTTKPTAHKPKPTITDTSDQPDEGQLGVDAVRRDHYADIVKQNKGIKESASTNKQPPKTNSDKIQRVQDSNSKVSKVSKNKKQKTSNNNKNETQKDDDMEDEDGDVEQRAMGAPGADVHGHKGRWRGTTASNIPAEIAAREIETYETYRHNSQGVWWYMNDDVVDNCRPTGTFSEFAITSNGVAGPSGVLKAVLNDLTANRQDLSSYYQLSKNTPISEGVIGTPLNFKVCDFLRHRDINMTGGEFRNYHRISLSKISVHIKIRTIDQSVFANHFKWGWLYRQNNEGIPIQDGTLLGPEYKRESITWSPKYMVYRDVYGEHIDVQTGLIPHRFNNPNLSELRHEQHNVAIVNDEISFSREIKAGGPYYFTPDTLWAQRDNSIDKFINAIEGQAHEGQGLLLPWPEYSNMLVAPIGIPMDTMNILRTANPVTWYTLFTPSYHTIFEITHRATFHLDKRLYKQSHFEGLPPAPAVRTVELTLKSDPYYQKEADYKFETNNLVTTH